MLALTYCISFLRGRPAVPPVSSEFLYVGAMLAHFSLLGAFFSILAVSWAFVGCFLLMLFVFLTIRAAPGQILERPGTILEGPKPRFSMFCRAGTQARRKNSACAKTTVFPRFLHGFYTSQVLCSSQKTTQNRSPNLSNRAPYKNCVQSASWGGFWKGLALSWASLGQLLSTLGRLLAYLGCFLGVSWALLGRSWLSLGRAGELQGHILAPRSVPSLDFKGFGDVLDWVLMGFWGFF